MMKKFHTVNLLLKNIWFVTNNVILSNVDHTTGCSQF